MYIQCIGDGRIHKYRETPLIHSFTSHGQWERCNWDFWRVIKLVPRGRVRGRCGGFFFFTTTIALSLSLSLGFYIWLLPTNGRAMKDTLVYLSENSRAAILHFHILIEVLQKQCLLSLSLLPNSTWGGSFYFCDMFLRERKLLNQLERKEQ